jgi:hypothetical protein
VDKIPAKCKRLLHMMHERVTRVPAPGTAPARRRARRRVAEVHRRRGRERAHQEAAGSVPDHEATAVHVKLGAERARAEPVQEEPLVQVLKALAQQHRNNVVLTPAEKQNVIEQGFERVA